jgi:hypothetical protein
VTSTGSNHLLVVSAFADETIQRFLTAVSGAGTWTLPSGCQNFTSLSGSVSCGYNLSSAPGATTITVTLQKSSSYQVLFWEYSFTSPSSAVDTSGTAISTGNGKTISGVGLNLTGSNDVIIQWTGCVPTGVASPYGHLIGNTEVKFADNENSTNVAANKYVEHELDRNRLLTSGSSVQVITTDVPTAPDVGFRFTDGTRFRGLFCEIVAFAVGSDGPWVASYIRGCERKSWRAIAVEQPMDAEDW